MLRFVSKIPSLTVVLVPGRQLVDQFTGLSGQIIPTKTAKFVRGHYEAKNEETAMQMLKSINDHKERRLMPTFWVHPDQESLAEELWARMSKPTSAPVEVASPSEQIAEMQQQLAKLTEENAKLRAESGQTKTSKKNAGGEGKK